MATIDEVLEILRSTGPEQNEGRTNHGPMAAEALIALGRDEAVLPWVEAYKTRLEDHPTADDRIRRGDWQDALGDGRRLGDWIAFFDNELAEAPWQAVIGEWVPLLAPAVMAASTHGLIRTSHAARSLSLLETPQRVHELAEGLGYWAARYMVFAGSPSPNNLGHAPAGALEQVQRVHGPDFQPAAVIHQEVQGLNERPEFAGAINLVDAGGDLSRFISDVTETFAGVYLANQANLVAFVHTVTAPSALRMLAPYLAESDARMAARYAWQACAAVYAWYSAVPPQDTSNVVAPIKDHQELIDRAVAAGGAHSIKLTEACLREYALNPKPVYLAAALDATERVGPV